MLVGWAWMLGIGDKMGVLLTLRGIAPSAPCSSACFLDQSTILLLIAAAATSMVQTILGDGKEMRFEQVDSPKMTTTKNHRNVLYNLYSCCEGA
jgi:hypothetical protein